MKITRRQLRQIIRNEILLEDFTSSIAASLFNLPENRKWIEDLINDEARSRVFRDRLLSWWRDAESQRKIDTAAAWALAGTSASSRMGAPAAVTNGLAASAVMLATLSLADEMGVGSEEGMFGGSRSKGDVMSAVKDNLVDIAIIYTSLKHADKIDSVKFLDDLTASTIEEIESNVDESMQSIITDAGIFDRDEVLRVICSGTFGGDALDFNQAKERLAAAISAQIDSAGDGWATEIGKQRLRSELEWLSGLTSENCAESGETLEVSENRLRQIIREELTSEIVRKRKCKTSDGKKGNYVLLRKRKPHKKLGCHKTRKGAVSQERAIKARGG